MAEDAGDKKYDATPHRLQEARRKGQVARSQDLVAVALLFTGLVILRWLGQAGASYLAEQTEQALTSPAWVKTDVTAIRDEAIRWGLITSIVIFPLGAVLAVVAVVGNLFQTGFLILPERLTPDPRRLDPIQGMQRLFGLQNLARTGFGLAKVAVVMGVAATVLWQERDQLMAVADMGAMQLASYLSEITLGVGMKIAGVLLILAILDYLFQVWKTSQDLRMTEQEMREEIKQTQGDPQIAARRRAVQRQLVMSRLSNSVPKAKVVISNPTEIAVALDYEPQRMNAPIVVAKGAGVLAQRIRRLALEHGIPIVERKELARMLYAEVDVDREVPSSAYAAVAEVLRYVYDLKGESPFAERGRAAS